MRRVDAAEAAGAPAPEEAAPLLEIAGLTVRYRGRAGDAPAVCDLDLSIAPGASIGLVGESGCGKTTVGLAILRYLGAGGRQTGGVIRFRGQDLGRLGARQLRRLRGREIAMVYQDPMAALNPVLRVGAQLDEVPRTHEPGCGRAEARQRSRALLERVRLADAERILEAYPHQLSGGQQQRVLIAMALLARPSLLILDEPTTALDVTVEAGIVELIGELARDSGTAILFISHNLGLIRGTCRQVHVMYAGRIVEQGPVEEIFAEPRHPYTQGLMACIPTPAAGRAVRPVRAIPGQPPLPHERAPGCAFAPRCGHARPGRCDREPLPLEPVAAPGHRVRCPRHAELPAPVATEGEPAEIGVPGPVLLESQGLSKHYPVEGRGPGALGRRRRRMVQANREVSFTSRQGEIVALVGESGCGKSTFARILLGLETASGGSLWFAGRDVARLPVGRRPARLLRALQMVFQNPGDTLNPSRSVGAQLVRALRRLDRRAGAPEARLERLLERVRLPAAFARRRPHQLSGGQIQRVGLARALAAAPAFLVADEPVSALDVSVQAAIAELLLDVQRRHGTSLLVISHDLGLVRYLAHRVVVMYLGQVMEQGTVEQVFAPPYHPYTEALLAAVPLADPGIGKRRVILEGPPPSVLDTPPGCPFAARCPRRLGPVCEATPLPSVDAGDGHLIRCHIPLDELRSVEPVYRQLR